MPRLNDRKYLQAHKRLKRYWDHDNMAYGFLTSLEQWQLHDYFQPSKDLTEPELLVHRVRITEERPNLPHQAGRALAKIDEIAPRVALYHVRSKQHAAQAAKHPGKRTNVRSRDRHIRVMGVVKPEIDTDKLARIVILMAEQLAREQAEGKQADDDTTAA